MIDPVYRDAAGMRRASVGTLARAFLAEDIGKSGQGMQLQRKAALVAGEGAILD